ncbi:hypothetical protein [Pseudoduganella sp. RAF53_2]|uniref:hypothetical protein n=1 Tax=unclassified Pseudoduganella TaxID=2637179 RepID=UPI003F9E2354
MISNAGLAQDHPVQDEPSVEVKEVRNPELRSYRNIFAGLAAFDEHRELAPEAPELRFRLLQRRGQPPLENGEPLTVRIRGKGNPVVIHVATDNTFAVPRMQSLVEEDADVMLNRRKGLVEGVALVRTPGLPDSVRRLGDLRLECQVMIAIGKQEVGFLKSAVVSTFLLGRNWCKQKKAQFWFDASHQLAGAVLHEGDRTAELKIRESSYLPPLNDDSWSNDALIELKYLSQTDASVSAAQ